MTALYDQILSLGDDPRRPFSLFTLSLNCTLFRAPNRKTRKGKVSSEKISFIEEGMLLVEAPFTRASQTRKLKE